MMVNIYLRDYLSQPQVASSTQDILNHKSHMSLDARSLDGNEVRRRQNSEAQRTYRKKHGNYWGGMEKTLEELESQEEWLKNELGDTEQEEDPSFDPGTQSIRLQTPHSSQEYFQPHQGLDSSLDTGNSAAAELGTSCSLLKSSSGGDLMPSIDRSSITGYMQSETRSAQNLGSYHVYGGHEDQHHSATLRPPMISANQMIPVFVNHGAGVQNYHQGPPYCGVPNPCEQSSGLVVVPPRITVVIQMDFPQSVGFDSQYMMQIPNPYLFSGSSHEIRY
jgi:hypothetical protein